MVSLEPSDITIAITVYNRRTYLSGAIASAIEQTLGSKHQVMVVEDCGPNKSLREEIITEFGARIRYHRNDRTRGLFDNWNACIELCTTRWLCILHDDDFLEPTFLEAMVELGSAASGRALYFGACHTINAAGQQLAETPPSASFAWSELDLAACCRHDPVCFPGQLFDVEVAREVGGFRPNSRYCGDWEMWFKLALRKGAAATNRVVANYREHHTLGRGTTNVDVSGKKYAYVNVQRKRHVAWLKKTSPKISFDRESLQRESPIPTRFLLNYAHSFSQRMLRYNAGLLHHSVSPHLGYWFYKAMTRLFTWRFLRLTSQLVNLQYRPR